MLPFHLNPGLNVTHHALSLLDPHALPITGKFSLPVNLRICGMEHDRVRWSSLDSTQR